jgi:hypothetical protein
VAARCGTGRSDGSGGGEGGEVIWSNFSAWG